MKQIRNNSMKSGIIVMLLMMMLLGGCVKSGIQIVPVPNQNVLTLTTDELITIMRRVGFSDMQIRQYGFDVWDGLKRSGRVEIRVDSVLEVSFAIKGEEVFIASRSRGYFIYNINSGWVEGQGYQNVPRR